MQTPAARALVRTPAAHTAWIKLPGEGPDPRSRPPSSARCWWWCSLRIIVLFIFIDSSCFCILVLWWRTSSSGFKSAFAAQNHSNYHKWVYYLFFFIICRCCWGRGTLRSAIAGKMKNLKRKKCVKGRLLYSSVNNSFFLLITVYIWFINLIIKSLKTSFLFIYMYVFRIEGFW